MLRRWGIGLVGRLKKFSKPRLLSGGIALVPQWRRSFWLAAPVVCVGPHVNLIRLYILSDPSSRNKKRESTSGCPNSWRHTRLQCTYHNFKEIQRPATFPLYWMSLDLREILVVRSFSLFLIVPWIVVHWGTALRHEFRQPLWWSLRSSPTPLSTWRLCLLFFFLLGLPLWVSEGPLAVLLG